MQDWAICMPGTFSRLAPHTAVLHALHNAYTKGDLASEPSYICTSSVAAIPANIALQRSEEKFIATEKMLINLKKRQFVSLHPQLKKNAAVDFLSMSGLLASAYMAGKLSEKNLTLGRIALIALFPAAYKLSEKAIKDIFNAPSFLVYDNLFNLLMVTLDFDAIFSSPIKIEMPAVNINKTGWTIDEILADPPLYLHGWKNQGWVSVTNFRPEDVDLPPDVRNEKYINKLINGLRVYGHFAPGRHENDDGIIDTAAITNLPVHFAINEGYTNVVILHYNPTSEGPTDRVFKNWVAHLNRAIDLNVSGNTRKTIHGYLRINNDLAELDKQLENLKRLENSLYGPTANQEAIRKFIRNQEESYRRLSYINKKRINFIFARSEPLPDAHFSDFTQDQMIEGINIGWKVGCELVPEINKMIA